MLRGILLLIAASLLPTDACKLERVVSEMVEPKALGSFILGKAYTRTQAPTIQDCAHLCLQAGNCKGIMYRSDSNHAGWVCSFTSDVTRVKNNNNWDVYSVACARYPSQMFPPGIAKTSSLNETDYKLIVNAVHEVYEKVSANVSANTNERGRFVGCLVRAAGHDFMDFRFKNNVHRRRRNQRSTGGSDGCIDFADEDNTGLPGCLKEFKIPELYKRFFNLVSLADFFVIIAEAAAGRTATGWRESERWVNESLEYRFLKSFKYGRQTRAVCAFSHGRMPNPEHGCEGRGSGKPGLKQLFVEHIFRGHEFPWTLTAAISGAHTVGSAKLANSGYEGYWSSAEQQGMFNNNYFERIILSSWQPEEVNDNPPKNQWSLADRNKNTPHKEMMLTTDMCLAYAYTPKRRECESRASQQAKEYYDKSGTKAPRSFIGHKLFCRYLYESVGPEDLELRSTEGYEDLDPTKHKCCAWVAPRTLTTARVLRAKQSLPPRTNETIATQQYCGSNVFDASVSNKVHLKRQRELKRDCCAKGKTLEKDCDNQYSGRGHAWTDILDFAREEFLFYKWYVKAWNIATERGPPGLRLKCLSPLCDDNRDVLTAKDEEKTCLQTQPDSLGCQNMRIADSKVYHPDSGLMSVKSWYRLAREAIPLELRKKGYNAWNIEQYFELPYVSATASTIGTLDFDHDNKKMPPGNLIKFSNWMEDMKAGRAWNRKHDFPWTMDGRTSTCWASENEMDPSVSLFFAKEEFIHKVAINGLYKGYKGKETLEGAEIWLRGKDGNMTKCGNIGKLESTKNGGKEDATQVMCTDGKSPPAKGIELIVKYPEKNLGKNKTLIICMAWAFRFDEKHWRLMDTNSGKSNESDGVDESDGLDESDGVDRRLMFI